MTRFFRIGRSDLVEIFCKWLIAKDLVKFDGALCNLNGRQLFLGLSHYSSFVLVYIPNVVQSNFVNWIATRGYKVKRLHIFGNVSLKTMNNKIQTEKISFYGSISNFRTILLVVRQSPILLSLDLSSIDIDPTLEVQVLCVCPSRLKQLSLRANATTFLFVAHIFTSLESLILVKDCCEITSSTFQTFFALCNFGQSLTTFNAPKLWIDEIPTLKLLDYFSNLTNIGLSCCNSVLEVILQSPEIEVVNLCDKIILDRQDSENIKLKLDLDSYFSDTIDLLTALNVASLYINARRIDEININLAKFSAVQELEFLDTGSIPSRSKESIKVNYSILVALIMNNKRLRSVYIDCSFNFQLSKMMTFFENCPKLERFCLVSCTQSAEQFVDKISKQLLPHLKQFHVRHVHEQAGSQTSGSLDRLKERMPHVDVCAHWDT